METVIISDTSCLVVLDKIGQLSLLRESYGNVVVTPTVAAEFGKTLPDWISVRSPASNSIQRLLEETLDPGESSSIALALEIETCFLILDDLRWRLRWASGRWALSQVRKSAASFPQPGPF